MNQLTTNQQPSQLAKQRSEQQLIPDSMAQLGGSVQQEMQLADMFAASSIVPANFQKKPADTFVAIQVAKQTGMTPYYVMQNMYVVYGRPSWSSQAIIAMINASGVLKGRLRWKSVTTDDGDQVCISFGTCAITGETLEAPYRLSTAKAEGLFDKKGSKWKTMPDLMLKYRAASNFGRLYCPDTLAGLHSKEEVEEMEPIQIENGQEKPKSKMEDLLS